MRHIRNFWALSLTREDDKTETLKGVRERKDVKWVRNRGRKDKEREVEREEN